MSNEQRLNKEKYKQLLNTLETKKDYYKDLSRVSDNFQERGWSASLSKELDDIVKELKSYELV